MASGGYHRPEKPAAVSGPGRYAKRTDGGASQPVRDMTGGAYGDNQEMANLQGAAPMNASGRTPMAPGPQVPQQAAPIVGFDAPSQRPGEPVTAGNPMGPGPGPAANPMSAARWSDTLKQVAASNPDGSLDDLIQALEDNGL